MAVPTGLAHVGGSVSSHCPSPSSSLWQHDVDFKGDDLEQPLANVTSAEQCCAACSMVQACKAFSFGPLPTYKCRLKKGTGKPQPMKGRVSLRVRPPPPPVKEIHVVFSNHFDGGCKIRGCNNVSEAPDFMWPIGCAETMHGPGQPHAYHVLNRYFDEYFPRAATIADEWRAAPAAHDGDKFVWMTQSWIISLFLNCETTFYNSWDPKFAGRGLLHCPNASAIARFKRAVSLGDITWHAAATDQEAEFFPNVGMFNASMVLAEELADQLGVPRPRAVSTRDVPFWTRAALPLLAARGILGMSFGSGTPPGRPFGVPPLFVWRDEASGAELVVTSESGYGGIGTEFILPNGVALAVDWSGDNSGPSQGLQGALKSLRAKYPVAHVHASTFSAFFEEASKPENKAKLPIVTSEIGDAWIYGVPSDPLKCAQFRAAARARDAYCASIGGCNHSSAPAAMKTFDRMLVKVPEHTWGLAQSWFLADYTNWSNVAFESARTAVTEPIFDNHDRGDYYTQQQSWHEQRSFVYNAVDALRSSSDAGLQQLARDIDAEFQILSTVSAPSTVGFVKVPSPSTALHCGGTQIGFDDQTGAINLLESGNGGSWANSTHPLGKFLYQSFNDSDFQQFLSGGAGSMGSDGTNNGRGSMAYCTPNNSKDASTCGNFNKPLMALGKPVHRELAPSLVSLWRKSAASGGMCEFLVEGSFPTEAHVLGGAPSTVWTLVTLTPPGGAGGDLKLELEYRLLNKTATRLPESLFVQFAPAVEETANWKLEMFNNSDIVLDPLDVLPSTMGGIGSGGAPHTRCVSAVRHAGVQGEFHLSSLDVPCICTGEPTPFPTPRNVAPDMTRGVAYNIYNNIWNTNYVLWYPFEERDKDIKARFSMRFSQQGQQ